MSSRRDTRRREQQARRSYGLIKLGGKCVKCGSTSNLEFDHIDREKKELEISRAWCYSFEKFHNELVKCQLLCVPCHHWKSSLEQAGTPAKVIKKLLKETRDNTTKEKNMYVKFTEHNDHEGETWHFYFPYDEVEVNNIVRILNGHEEYELSTIEENEVDVLVKHTDVGYMAKHTKLGPIMIPEDAQEEDFYKGGIEDFQIA